MFYHPLVLSRKLANFPSYMYFQMRTHHGLYDSVLEKDEARDHDRHKDLQKAKLTLTECVLALVIALTCVSLHAVFLGKVQRFCYRHGLLAETC